MKQNNPLGPSYFIVVYLCLSKQTQMDVYNMTSSIVAICLVLLGKS